MNSFHLGFPTRLQNQNFYVSDRPMSDLRASILPIGPLALQFGAKDKIDKMPIQPISKSPSPKSSATSGGKSLLTLLTPLITAIQAKSVIAGSGLKTEPDKKLDLTQPQDAVLYVQRCQQKVKTGEPLNGTDKQNLRRIRDRFAKAHELAKQIYNTLQQSATLSVKTLLPKLERAAFEQEVAPNGEALQQCLNALGEIESDASGLTYLPDLPHWQDRLTHVIAQQERLTLREQLASFQKRLKSASPLRDDEWVKWQGLAQSYALDVANMLEPVSSLLKPFPPLLKDQVWVLDYLPLISFHQAMSPRLLPAEEQQPQNTPQGKITVQAGIGSQSASGQSSLPQSSLPQSSLPQSSLPQSSLPQSSLPQSSLPWIDLPQPIRDDVQLAFERNLIHIDQLKTLQANCIKATFNAAASKLSALMNSTINQTKNQTTQPVGFQEQVIDLARYMEELSRRTGAFSRKQADHYEMLTRFLGVLLCHGCLNQGDPNLVMSSGLLKGASPEQQKLLLYALAEGVITLSKPTHLKKERGYRKAEEAVPSPLIEAACSQVSPDILKNMLQLTGFQEALSEPQKEFIQSLIHESSVTLTLQTLSTLPTSSLNHLDLKYRDKALTQNALRTLFTSTLLSHLSKIQPTLLAPETKTIIQQGLSQYVGCLYEESVVKAREAFNRLDLAHPPKTDSVLSLTTYPVLQLGDPSLIKLCQGYQLDSERGSAYKAVQKLSTALKNFRHSELGILYNTLPLQGRPDNRLASPVKVMTYNVQNLEVTEDFDRVFEMQDGFQTFWSVRYSTPLPPQTDAAYQSAWQEYKALVSARHQKDEERLMDLANKIRQADADVIVLQESNGLVNLMKFLQNTALEGQYPQVIYAPAVHCGKGNSGNPYYHTCKTGLAILAKKDIPLDTRQMELVHTGLLENPPGPRGMLSVAIGKPTDRTQVQLVGTHLKAFGRDSTKVIDEAIQEAELGQLEAYIEGRQNVKPNDLKPMMVLGDFNRSDLQLEGIKELLPENADIGTYCAGGAQKIVHHSVGSTKRSANRLDKIFLKDSRNQLLIQGIRILAKENEPSDHRPVIVQIQENVQIQQTTETTIE